MNWAISSRASNRRRFNDYPVAGSSLIAKYGLPKFIIEYGKDIVYSFVKAKVERKIDIGYMAMPVTEDDLKALESLLSSQSIIQPNLSYHIYKNRRGKFNNIKLWCSADLGTCRINPLFMTTNDYELTPVEDLKIKTLDVKKIEF